MSTRKVSNLTKKKVAACQEWKCKLCNCLLDECFEIDHIICIKDGGNNEECNLQALCPNCHRKKTNNDIYKPKKLKKKFIYHNGGKNILNIQRGKADLYVIW
jgi:5-methylcytosine-specific restriction endonuclease McrA